MKHLLVALSACFLAGCNTTPRPFVFAGAVDGWTLVTSGEADPTRAPESVRKLGIKRSQSGDYQGPGTITVQIYEMTSPSGAFEAEQTWRASGDTVGFHKGSRFAVIHWQSLDRSAVSAFVRQIEKQLEP